ncbi:serine/threonine protein kinase with TPR repeats [Stanieria sp. NIES-3757]|nr:serine/threonine protein kinase with TPR repeats [Stanieria sp. NIES-3757]
MKSIVGKILRGRYFIVRELGKSNASITYLAEDRTKSDHQQCVVKQLQPQISSLALKSEPQLWHNLEKLFITEAITLKRLGKHPQIPQLFDYFEQEKQFYFVEELIEGQNLEREVQEHTFNESQVIALLQNVLKILDFVHQQGVIHRDIRPSNLIRRSDGSFVLIDFGLIKNLTLPINNSSADPPTVILGTLGYTPPEQMEGNPHYNSDIYALGKTAIFAFLGHLPNSKLTSSHHLSQVNKVDVAELDCSTRLTTILRKMIEPIYQERYQSAVQVLTELEREENVITLPPPFMVSPPYTEIPPRIIKNKQQLPWKKVLFWMLLILPFIGALLLLFAGIEKNLYRNFSLYINNQYNLEIRYPENWSLEELEDPITGEVVVFYSPLETDADLFQEKVSVTVEELTKDLNTLDEYSERIISSLSSNKDSTLSIYSQEKTKLAQQPARTLLYSRIDNGINLRQMETFTIKNNKIYIVTYTAERAKYSKFLDTAKKMINSFSLTKSK